MPKCATIMPKWATKMLKLATCWLIFVAKSGIFNAKTILLPFSCEKKIPTFWLYEINPSLFFLFSPSHEDLKALIAQAHRSVYKCDSSPIITDLIDNIMSIPSCLQVPSSKLNVYKLYFIIIPSKHNFRLTLSFVIEI